MFCLGYQLNILKTEKTLQFWAKCSRRAWQQEVKSEETRHLPDKESVLLHRRMSCLPILSRLPSHRSRVQRREKFIILGLKNHKRGRDGGKDDELLNAAAKV